MLENRQKVDFHHNWSILLNYFGLWGNHATFPQRQYPYFLVSFKPDLISSVYPSLQAGTITDYYLSTPVKEMP
jgi:hypothetical protein